MTLRLGRGNEAHAERPDAAWPWLLSDRGILTIACGVAAVGLFGLIGMWLIADGVNGNDQAALKIDAIKYGLGFLAAGGAAAALLLNVRRQRLSEKAHDLELRRQAHAETDNAERQVTELYTRAVEQLGHTDAAVRLGGLYALERVAQNNVAQRQTVVDVICAYLRMPYTPPAEVLRRNKASSPYGLKPDEQIPEPDEQPQRRQELQVRVAAQRLLGRHIRAATSPDEPEPDALWRGPNGKALIIDLAGASLVELNFEDCLVDQIDFARAQFHGKTRLLRAHVLGDANLIEAQFHQDANLASAEFHGSVFMRDARFYGAAHLVRAHFYGDADLGRAQFLEDANLLATEFHRDTDLGRAKFRGRVFMRGARFYREAYLDAAAFRADAELKGALVANSATLPSGWTTNGRDSDGLWVVVPANSPMAQNDSAGTEMDGTDQGTVF